MTLDLPALKEVAMAATQGQWTVEMLDGYITGHITSPQHTYSGNTASRKDSITDENSMTASDAQHIATFSPSTVLALIAEIERLRGGV